eukprot:s1080_g22.t1
MGWTFGVADSEKSTCDGQGEFLASVRGFQWHCLQSKGRRPPAFEMLAILLAALVVQGEKYEIVTGTEHGAADKVLTGAKVTTLSWGKPTRTVKQSLEDAFPRNVYPDGFWSNFSYTHSPLQQITGKSLADWVKTELLGGPSPFSETDGKVPVPLKQDNRPGLDELQYVGYTRRQLCYIVAKILIGSDTLKFQNGLKAFLDREGPNGCIPRTDGFGRSFWTLLASCYADPNLVSGQGPMIVISKGSQQVVSAELLQGASLGYKLSAAKLKICRYDDGSEGSPLPGVAMVNSSRCAKAKRGERGDGAGMDFMSTESTDSTDGGQAMQVMTQGFLGGRLFGINCNFGGGQSEHMAFVMPVL